LKRDGVGSSLSSSSSSFTEEGNQCMTKPTNRKLNSKNHSEKLCGEGEKREEEAMTVLKA
jgi:hypothetical protein